MKIKSILVSVLALFALVGTSFAAEEILAEYGPITIKKVDNKKIAYIDDDANVPLPEIKNVRVDGVSFNRVFKGTKNASEVGDGGVASTLMLPFDIGVSELHTAMNYNYNFSICEFVKVTTYDCQHGNTTTGKIGCKMRVYARQYDNSDMIKANTPYIFLVSGRDDLQIEFTKSVTLNTTTNSRHHVETIQEDGINYDWDFIGTYEKIQFTKSTLPGVYGFAGEEKDGTKIGTFKKGNCKDNECASVRAFRAYLHVTAQSPSRVNGLAKEGNEVASLENLPSTVEVHVITGKDSTLFLGTMNTRTGEIVVEDRWFDMKGRRLMQKPTAKGTYYNNRKKVVIK